jgi:hypothetical protein
MKLRGNYEAIQRSIQATDYLTREDKPPPEKKQNFCVISFVLLNPLISPYFIADAFLLSESSAIYGTRRYVTMFKSTGSYPELDEFRTHFPTIFLSILILFYHLRLGLPSGLFPCTHFSSLPNMLHAPPAHPFRFHRPNSIWRRI